MLDLDPSIHVCVIEGILSCPYPYTQNVTSFSQSEKIMGEKVMSNMPVGIAS